MFYLTLLLLHIVIASLSVLLHLIFVIKIFNSQHTKRLANLVGTSSALTVLSGVILLVGGSDISRTCITMGAFSLISFFCFYIAQKQGYRTVATQVY